jgi:ATP-dependent RNA helicase SUPV3L1/SUV3
MTEPTTTVALLGPTNTGKTHRAVERMLEYPSGMIGLPLRLLAREIYDRVTARVGEQAVALVTGEEKRIPPRPRYFVCTVESMPLDRMVDFVAIDEVQLAVHPQRGHVFTDRLLNARGRHETWFLGAHTMRSMMEALVPTATVQRHPRLSKLSSVGPLGLAALPPRSALIAFSAAEVYELADRLRRRRGGAAVVMGALSPRTRNAQVAMYQSGEVDYLVATDAVGMGLNMDVDHVAFAALRKFDGTHTRALAPEELAQIAGRAGRHIRDGTFGTLAPLAVSPEVVYAIEAHRFADVRRVMWRNSDLDMSSLAALQSSLSAPSRRPYLMMVDDAADVAALRILSARPDVAERARHPDGVRLLWDVCRIPDFRKLMVEYHAALLHEIFVQLSGPRGRLQADFMQQRVGRLEDDSGDIDTLMMRMELLRTWNYVTHHAAWVEDASSWQERTQRAEDFLSQALHERLIERFVERSRRRRRHAPAKAPVSFEAKRADGPFAQLSALLAPAHPTGDDWVEDAVSAAHPRFSVDAQARIHLGDEEIAKLTRGVDLLHPEIKLALRRSVSTGAASRLQRRMRAYARDLVCEVLGPLAEVNGLGPAGRGLVYQLERALGTVDARDARAQLKELSREDRDKLAAHGVVEGKRHVFVASALGSEMLTRRAALARAFFGRAPSVTDSETSLVPERGIRREAYLATGYALTGARAVRVDVIERLLDELAVLDQPFALSEAHASLAGCVPDDLARIVRALGYHETDAGFVRARRRQGARKRSRS